jgi:hypothetical protein
MVIAALASLGSWVGEPSDLIRLHSQVSEVFNLAEHLYCILHQWLVALYLCHPTKKVPQGVGASCRSVEVTEAREVGKTADTWLCPQLLPFIINTCCLLPCY